MKKESHEKEIIFIESVKGIFLSKTGWLQLNSEVLEKMFPGLFEKWDRREAYEIVNRWAEQETLFPAYLALLSVLWIPFWMSFILFFVLVLLMIYQRSLLFSLRLDGLFRLFDKPLFQIGLTLVVISILGIQKEYIALGFAVIWLFLIRLQVLSGFVRILIEKVLKKTDRHEKLLLWICLKAAIREDIPVKQIEEMKQRITQATKRSGKK